MEKPFIRDRFADRLRVNERIGVKQVKVIGPDGRLLGIMSTEEALRKAYELDLDLVEIVPTERPPICKIIDYGKYIYELKKKEKGSKKHQVGVHLKEVRFTSRIGDNDYRIKLKHIREFLEQGDRVKVVVNFRGREITHKELGDKLLERIIDDTKDIGKVEFGPKSEGKLLLLQLVPAGKRETRASGGKNAKA